MCVNTEATTQRGHQARAVPLDLESPWVTTTTPYLKNIVKEEGQNSALFGPEEQTQDFAKIHTSGRWQGQD